MTTTLFAHAGHGVTSGNSLIHHLSEPVHAAFLLAAIAVVVGVNWYVRRTLTSMKARNHSFAKH